MTDERLHIGGTDVVLPDIDKALERAIDGLDDLSAAIKRHVEAGVPIEVAGRLLFALPSVKAARDTTKEIFRRLYSGLGATDILLDEDIPW